MYIFILYEQTHHEFIVLNIMIIYPIILIIYLFYNK